MQSGDVTNVSFECESCGAALSFPVSKCGDIEVCPHCSEYVDIPYPPGPEAEAAAAEQLDHEDLPVRLQCDVVDGFPRPRWFEFAESLSDELSVDQLNSIYAAAVELWIGAIMSRLPPVYHTTATPDFRVLFPASEDIEVVANFCETTRQELLALLEGVADDGGYGPHVVLAFADARSYYDYVVSFYEDEGEFGGSCGMCIRSDGYMHIALHYAKWDWRNVVVHELTHNLLGHLALPVWVEEGLVQLVEDQMSDRTKFFAPDHPLQRRHRDYWSANSMEGFWTGSAFSAADEGQELSYSLAQILMWNLFRDHRERVNDFIVASNWEDAGQHAARSALGMGLEDIVASFLGPGDWQPAERIGNEERPLSQ